jgi:hypothetical protein
MKSNLLKSLMFISLVCFMWACGDDDEKKEPLKPAYLELSTATDANLIFTGDAGEQTVALSANREVAATASESWVTPTVTVNADQSVSLKVAVSQSTATKRRTATIALTTKLAEEGDQAASPVTINLEQGVYGLPEADLLNLVFSQTGGPGAARDISPLENTVLDMTTKMNDDGVTEACPKVYPTISMNTRYGRYSAHFAGANCAPIRNDRGSCAYRVDFVDYSKVQQHYFPLDPPSYDGNMPNNTQIPFTALGEGLNKSFSIEVIFSLAPERLNGSSTILSWSQSFGASLGSSGTDDPLSWYLDTGPMAICDACSDPISLLYKKPGESEDHTGLERGVYYHAVATYDRDAGKMAIYVDGQKGGERLLQPGYVLRNAQPYKSDALAQWIAIGGDARRADPFVNGQYIHMIDGWENWVEWIFTGEIVVTRIYGKVLSDAEIKTLYDYEKPEE